MGARRRSADVTLHSIESAWREDFVDLPSLNASVSDEIEAAARHVLGLASTEPERLRARSILVLGPPGAGKTHLFERLRRRLGPKAVFVYLRPYVSSDLGPRSLLRQIVQQLAQKTGQVEQLHVLVGSLFAHFGEGASQFPRAALDDVERLSADERRDHIESTIEKALEVHPDIDDGWLRTLLRAAFASPLDKRAMLAWLSGDDCDTTQLGRLGRTASLGEDLVMPALKTVSAVASVSAPLVLVFDQLENLATREDSRDRILAYANLVMELVDTVPGVVTVHMAIDSEWARAIEPVLGMQHKARLGMRRLALALPKPPEREALLERWLEVAAPGTRVVDVVGADGLRELLAMAGATPRMLMTALLSALADGPPTAPRAGEEDASESLSRQTVFPLHELDADRRDDALASAWEAQLDAARDLLARNAERGQPLELPALLDAISCLVGFLPGLSILKTVPGEPAQLTLGTRRSRPAGLDAQGGGKLRVALVQHAHPKTIGATLARLDTMAALDPVLAIRERDADLAPTWRDTIARRDAFLERPNARWLLLDREECVRILALDALTRAARSGDVADHAGRPVTEPVVRAWALASLSLPRGQLGHALLTDATSAPEPQDRAPGIAGDAAIEPASQKGPKARARSIDAPPPGLDARGGPALHVVRAVLERLHVASLDRVRREVRRVDQAISPDEVRRALAALPVRWFGGSIVAVDREERR